MIEALHDDANDATVMPAKDSASCDVRWHTTMKSPEHGLPVMGRWKLVFNDALIAGDVADLAFDSHSGSASQITQSLIGGLRSPAALYGRAPYNDNVQALVKQLDVLFVVATASRRTRSSTVRSAGVRVRPEQCRGRKPVLGAACGGRSAGAASDPFALSASVMSGAACAGCVGRV